MRRFVIVTAGLVVLTVSLAGTATADIRTCPPPTSGWRTFSILAEPGDPAPAPGLDPIWDFTRERAALEGLTLGELADVFGVADETELYAGLLSFMIGGDHNGDGTICVKSYPLQQDRYPAFIFRAQDNSANVPG